ncbi:MAG: hypothetical protein U9R37_04250 [Campylobacterota bacterium]|nr:hypothetical protein [Campylobacterota bacterium]
MNELMFFLSLVVLAIVFFSRHKITNKINYTLSTNLQSEYIVYILFIFFVMVIAAGMLLDDTKAKYSGISESYENLKTPKSAERPHRYFDIDTYNDE